MKLKTKILTITILGLIGTFIIFKIGLFRSSNNDIIQVLNKIFAGNEIIVSGTSEINLDAVLIKIAYSDKVVFQNNKFNDNIGKEYGGPIFDVFYNEALIGRGLHYNTNNWYVNRFVFDFFRKNNDVKFTFKTIGKSSGGQEGYIWIDSINNTDSFKSFTSKG